MYIVDEVEDKYLDLLNEGVFELQEENVESKYGLSTKIQSVFGITYQEPKKRLRIGIANFGTGQLRDDPFRPKVNLFGLIEGIWFDNHDWKHYCILMSDLPTMK